MLTVGSLFAGIGGFDLGLERAGMRVIWQCEKDPAACAVLRSHWSVPIYDDVTTIRGIDVERPDVLCGGFPCVDISTAGKCAGIDGPESGLWSEFARLIRELRPRFVLVENVAALLNRGMGRVIGDLAAIGYDAEWHCIQAADVGAPHRRDRVFVCAYADERGREGERIAQHGGEQGASRGESHGLRSQRWRNRAPIFTRHLCRELDEIAAAEISPDADGERGCSGDGARQDATDARESSRRAVRGPWHSESGFCRVANGVPARVDRLRCLGNAIVPQIAEIVGRAVIAFDDEREAQQ